MVTFVRYHMKIRPIPRISNFHKNLVGYYIKYVSQFFSNQDFYFVYFQNCTVPETTELIQRFSVTAVT